MTVIAKRRRSAAESQDFKCYYCGLPMWEADIDAFARRHRVTVGQAQLLRCTAEHMRARCDGGADTSDNLVAAHAYCNRMRHARPRPMSASRYRQFVRARMESGRWLAGMLPGSVVNLGKMTRA